MCVKAAAAWSPCHWFPLRWEQHHVNYFNHLLQPVMEAPSTSHRFVPVSQIAGPTRSAVAARIRSNACQGPEGSSCGVKLIWSSQFSWTLWIYAQRSLNIWLFLECFGMKNVESRTLGISAAPFDWMRCFMIHISVNMYHETSQNYLNSWTPTKNDDTLRWCN